MQIVVCIKQVPDTSDIRWTENNTMIREGVESILNPYDELALEQALRIKDKYPETSIIVLSMGPQQAQDILKKAIAMGADRAVLVSDKKFAGSDTFVTSKILSRAIQKQVPNFDIIFCGQYAIDGDTAQTGPGVAEHLDIPQVTFATDAVYHSNTVTVRRELEYGLQTVKTDIPCLICVTQNDNLPRKPLIAGFLKAKDVMVENLSSLDLELEFNEIGVKGSPTSVSKVFRHSESRNCQYVSNENIKNFVQNLIELLQNGSRNSALVDKV